MGVTEKEFGNIKTEWQLNPDSAPGMCLRVRPRVRVRVRPLVPSVLSLSIFFLFLIFSFSCRCVLPDTWGTPGEGFKFRLGSGLGLSSGSG